MAEACDWSITKIPGCWTIDVEIMKIGKWKLWGRKKKSEREPGRDLSQHASFPTGGSSYGHRRYNPLITIHYDGEKNPGELGVIKRYIPEYRALRYRAWQAYMESDVIQAAVETYASWVIGSGLKPQISPVSEILENRGIGIDNLAFSAQAERQFNMWLNSRTSTYNNESSLAFKMQETFKNNFLSGDTLVVLLVNEGRLSVQCIDAEKLYSPILGGEVSAAKRRGNKLVHGVEIDPQGKHVAYYVWEDNEHRRIEAFSRETGMRMAYLVYGGKYKYDNVRGIPRISSILEAAKKLDRYKEAAVGGAEERAKIAYFIEHRQGSNEENPMIDNVRSGLPLNREIDGAPNDPIDEGIKLQQKITSTTGKSAFNMPLESTIKAMESEMELGFRDFFMSNLQPLYAAVGIPIEVALKKFDNNFSSSRASLKMWEHNIKSERNDFSFHFLGPIYQLWLLLEDIRGDISAPGLFNAMAVTNDMTLIEAYTKIRFNGPSVPHVDPMKEVKAEREKLGPKGRDVPLTTPQEAIKNLGGEDIDMVKEAFEREIEGFEVTEAMPEANDTPEEDEDNEEPELSIAN